MSTRGAVGIIKNGIEKIAYNHWDSYPSGLGQDILNWLKGKSINDLETEFDNIVLINEHKECGWNGKGFNSEFQDAKDFLFDSLFCEFAYIINLDTNMLEFYIGFNRDENAKGRYAKVKEPCELSDGSFLYGVRLDLEMPLNEVFEGKWKVIEEEGKEGKEGFVKL